MSNVLEKVADLTTLNIVWTARAMLINFCKILQDDRFLFGYAKYFACFIKLFPVKKLKVILWKNRKLQLLSIFRCQDIPKIGLHSTIMFPLQFTTSWKVTWKTIAFLKFQLVMYKQWFILTKDHQHDVYSSLFYMLVRMYAMVKGFSFTWLFITVHFLSYLLNAKLYT